LQECFRSQHIYTEEVNEILQKNEEVLQKLFDCHSKTKYITLEECLMMLNKAHIKVPNVKNIYIECLMSKVDTMRDPSEMMRMGFTEFVVFIARISEWVVTTKAESHHIKVDKVLGSLFSTIKA
jgi:hypothetical protein